MDKTIETTTHKKNFIGPTSLLIAVLVPVLIIQPYFAYLGIALASFLLTGIALYYKNTTKQSFESYGLAGIVCVAALLTLIRTNPFLLLLLYIVQIYGLSWMYLQWNDKYRPYLVGFAPVLVFIQALIARGGWEGYGRALKSMLGYVRTPVIAGVATMRQTPTDQWVIKIMRGIVSLIISGILFIILTVILASVNPIFAQIIEGSFDGVWEVLAFFGRLINIFSVFGFMRLIVFVLLLVVTPRLLIVLTNDASNLIEFDIPTEKAIKFMLPKIVILGLLSVFVITQFGLYTASYEGLVALGITAAERVNEVFGQLSWVVLIVLGLLFFDVTKSRAARIVSYMLITLGLIMVGFALYSNLYYIEGFGLSLKRLYGLAVIIWLVMLSCIILMKNIASISHSLVLKYASLVTLCVVILIGMVNFDAQIYAYNKPSFASNMSFDAIPTYSSDSDHLLDVITLHRDVINRRQKSGDEVEVRELIRVDYNQHIEYGMILQDKYCGKFPILGFNMQEYRTAQTLCGKDLGAGLDSD